MMHKELGRDVIITPNKAGKSNGNIVKEFNLKLNKVYRAVKQFQEVGSTSDRPRSGQPRTQRTLANIKAAREKVFDNPRHPLSNMAS